MDKGVILKVAKQGIKELHNTFVTNLVKLLSRHFSKEDLITM